MILTDHRTSCRNVMYSVEVEDATLTLGRGKQAVQALKKVKMALPEGKICAILGPSGCGKTTLLKCVVGLECLQKGQVKVFGSEPGTRESGVPGPSMGYMPQELSLYSDLTIFETLSYFGSLQLMPDNEIQQRTEFLLKLLDIPTRPGLLVKELSGGQQRRLSMASALIHDPPIVLLDEPTVGVDPLMRKSIWKHLDLLAHVQGKTVIITTHYVEEARRADLVSFMRDGEILLTDEPDHLMAKLNCNSLEDVFLKIVNKDTSENNIERLTPNTRTKGLKLENGVTENSTSSRPLLNTKTTENRNSWTYENTDLSSKHTPKKDFKSHDSTDLEENISKNSPADENTDLNLNTDLTLNTGFKTKNTTDLVADSDSYSDDTGHEVWIRQSVAMLTKLTNSNGTISQSESSRLVDEDTKSSSRAVYRFGHRQVNRRKSSFKTFVHLTKTILWKNSRIMRRNILLVSVMFAFPLFTIFAMKVAFNSSPFDLPTAIVNDERPANKSTDFLNKLDKRTFKKNFLNHTEEAIALIREGKVWAAIHVKDKFTEDFKERVLGDSPIDALLSESRNVILYVDSTNLEIFRTVYVGLFDAYQEFSDSFYLELNVNPTAMRGPLVFKDPVFGSNRPDFADFINTNVLADGMFLLSMGLAALTFITENVSGLLNRCKVSGLTEVHVLFSHVLLNAIFAGVQLVIVLSYTAISFSGQLASDGLVMVGLLCFLTSNAGMAIGILASAVTSQPFATLLLAASVHQMNAMASGMLWPFEGQPLWIRYLTSFSPETFTIQALREVIHKKRGLGHRTVWYAVLVGLAWTMCPLVLAVLITHIRRHWKVNSRQTKLDSSINTSDHVIVT